MEEEKTIRCTYVRIKTHTHKKSHFRPKVLSRECVDWTGRGSGVRECVDWTGRGSGVQTIAPAIMTDSKAPTIVDSTFTVKGGLLIREAKVPLTPIVVDGKRQFIFKIRKRDYWMHGAFVPKRISPVV